MGRWRDRPGVSPANLRGNNHYLGAGRSEAQADFLAVNLHSRSSAVLLARSLSEGYVYRLLNIFLSLPLLEARLSRLISDSSTSDYYSTTIGQKNQNYIQSLFQSLLPNQDPKINETEKKNNTQQAQHRSYSIDATRTGSTISHAIASMGEDRTRYRCTRHSRILLGSNR